MRRDCDDEDFLVRRPIDNAERETLDEDAPCALVRRCAAKRVAGGKARRNFNGGLETDPSARTCFRVVLDLPQ